MARIKQFPSLALLAVIAVLLVSSLTAAFWDYTQDEVFITYVYSRNLSEGQGFVFNHGERVQGTISPLHTLIMAGVYRLTDDLLHAGNLLSAIYLLGAIGLAVALLRGFTSIYAQAALVLIIATSPLVYVSFGMETLLYSLLLMLAFWLWSWNRRMWAMLAAAALTWTRADGVILAGSLWLAAAIGALYQTPQTQALRLYSNRPVPVHGDSFWGWFRREGLPLGLIYMAGIAPWYLFAWNYFGTPLPNIFIARQEIVGGVRWWQDGYHWWTTFYGNNPFTVLLIPPMIIGLWRALRRVALRPLGLWVLLYMIGYTVLNVTAFWYYTPWFMGLIVLAVLGGDWRIHWAWEHFPSQRGWIRVIAVGLVLVITLLSIRRALEFAEAPERVAAPQIAGDWIDEHTPQDATLLSGD